MSQIIPIKIPTYISDQNYNPSRVLPRLLFYNGMVDSQKWYIESGSTGVSGVAKEQNAFPYFDNYNVVSGSFPTTGSKSLLFFNENAAYGEVPTDSLYTDYWETYVELLYNPRTRLLNASAIIPLADYFEMELNDIVQFRGNYYHLRSINNYSLKNGECEISLLGPVIDDTISTILSSTRIIQPPNCNYDSLSVVCNLDIQYLAVGGGGASGADRAGGGGGGGLRSGSASITSGTYTVIVGNGGNAISTNGTNSVLQIASASIALGGGGGGSNVIAGQNGGSGGGSAGLGNIFQGKNGGLNSVPPDVGCGGGGGALTSGSMGMIQNGGDGGSGSLWINNVRYAGGGGGAGDGPSSDRSALGGPGGGGAGGNTFNAPPGSPGTDNLGGGGGGGFTFQKGGSGVVIIAYAGSGSQATGGTLSYDGTYTYHTFTSSSLAGNNGTGSFIY